MIFELFHKRALVTRDAARTMEAVLRSALTPDDTEVRLDFTGVDAVTPSFVDEALSVIERTLTGHGEKAVKILFLNPPTRLSAKFAAIARAHSVDLTELPSGSWVVQGTIAQEPV